MTGNMSKWYNLKIAHQMPLTLKRGKVIMINLFEWRISLIVRDVARISTLGLTAGKQERNPTL